ncbi:MAG TPA: lytic transglycosylase domain-containing protein [Pyrinomonadaceae bacterium]|nr:lytic transglycosylase domain-containing protein [Pyrinomonadaceae bacterium]
MKLARKLPLFRTVRYPLVALVSFFLFTNLTGILFSRVLAPEVVAHPTVLKQMSADIPTSGSESIDRLIFDAGAREGVDPRFIHAVIWQESRYKTNAQSHAGAVGLMQLMPAAAERFGCADRNDPAANIAAGTKYLRWLLKRFDGNVELALAGYNAGEGSVDKYDGIPPYKETKNYVKVISERYGKTYHSVLPPQEAEAEFKIFAESEVAMSE